MMGQPWGDTMPKVRVNAFAISLDGYGAGPDQSLDNPLGRGGEALHEWFYPTRTFQRMFGKDEGTTGAADEWAARSLENVGAWIMGRNMFGPQRGPWPDDGWRGWWGDEPVYHCPVFVLTHYPRPPLEMKGGTVFHFVSGDIEDVLYCAREAAGARDVRIGGGVATVREYLGARLVDEMHIVVSPVVLGGGESLFGGLDLPRLGYEVTEHAPTESATHVVFSKRA
jgi:dihydrofolate reductase